MSRKAPVRAAGRVRGVALAAVLGLFAGAAEGAFFPPSEAEWATWPDYCKARHTSIEIYAVPKYKRRVSNEMRQKWRTLLGDQTWTNIHHGCQAILHIARAERMRGAQATVAQRQKFEWELKQADQEATYSLNRTPPDHPVYHYMDSILARVTYLRGNKVEAIARLRSIVSKAPDQADMVATLALYLYREKSYAEARDVLLSGLKHVETPSAEMHYFLGLTYVKLKNWDAAREQARKAYALGYPLPGLKNKLRAAGQWTG